MFYNCSSACSQDIIHVVLSYHYCSMHGVKHRVLGIVHSSVTREPSWGVTIFGYFPNGLGRSRCGVALAIACNP